MFQPFIILLVMLIPVVSFGLGAAVVALSKIWFMPRPVCRSAPSVKQTKLTS